MVKKYTRQVSYFEILGHFGNLVLRLCYPICSQCSNVYFQSKHIFVRAKDKVGLFTVYKYPSCQNLWIDDYNKLIITSEFLPTMTTELLQ
ncbi:MAG: hypothetical protein ACFFCQ_11265 [Promethearchaeota archaeon]